MDTYPYDTLRDSFLKLVSDGLTHEEALDHFDENELRAAALAELNEGLLRRLEWSEVRPDAYAFVTNDSREMPALLEILSTADSQRRNGVNGRDYGQALELWQAGWSSETERPDMLVMAWRWRAPSKRPGRPGRRFLSTNQAWNALKKAQ